MSAIKRLGIPRIKAVGLDNIVNNKKNIEEVYKIKLLTTLDEGSANEKDISKKQKGMLNGRTYAFQVEAYIGEKPGSANLINWELSYFDLDENIRITLPISGKGERIDLVMENLDTCGRYVEIRAYIHDKNNNAVLKIWKHNRFRWFNGTKLYGEIQNRTIKP